MPTEYWQAVLDAAKARKIAKAEPPDFEKTGVNPDNVVEWRKLIEEKNPWLERQGDLK